MRFSVITIYYHKDFFVFPRYKEGQKESTNSRIASILNGMELSERRLSGNESVEECVRIKIDWEKVQGNLEIFRERSVKWYEDALEDAGLLDN